MMPALRRTTTLAQSRAWVAIVLCLALGAIVAPAHAAAPDRSAVVSDSGRGLGAVTGVRIIPGSGKAEVVIATDGEVDPSDFTLNEPNRIVIDVAKSSLQTSPALYDKVARGGITNLRIAQYRPDVVRIVVELDGPRNYSLVKGERDVRIQVEASESFKAWNAAAGAAASRREMAVERAVAEAAGPTIPKPAAMQQTSDKPRISVTYVDADIRDVVAAFASFSGRTIVLGKTVAGTIPYLDIKDKPWDIALKAILESQGLAASEDASGILTVDSYVNILAKQASEPLETRFVRLNYASANSLLQTVRSLLSRDCTAAAVQGGQQALQAGSTGGSGAVPAGCIVRGSVVADSGTNAMLVTDVPSRMPDLLSYVRDLDIRTPQVAIKAKIILVNRSQIEDLGLRYDLGKGTDQFYSTLVSRVDPSTLRPVDTNGDGVPDALGGGTAFTGDRIALGGNALAGIANASARVANPTLSLVFSTALGKYDLTSFLDALAENTLADVQAEPSIVTLDNKPAQIFSGSQIPFRQVDAGSLTGGGTAPARAVTSFQEAGIKLAVTPHVSFNRQILLSVNAENSSPTTGTGDGNPIINRQTAQNQLLVGDGETAVIGGLTVTSVSTVRTGIPYLKDLPLIGFLFRRQQKQDTKSDLLILITPHILDEGERASPPRNR